MENPKCGGLQSVKGKDVITVNCGGLTGRYVGIALPGKRQYLILCEVEVYGGRKSKFYGCRRTFIVCFFLDKKKIKLIF